MKLSILLVVLTMYAFALGSVSVSYEVEPEFGHTPSFRGAATMAAIDGTLVLFGGFFECFDAGHCSNIFFDDTFHYDIDSARWSLIHPGVKPGARAFHSIATYDQTDSLVIYGGVRYQPDLSGVVLFQDMWQYFPSAETWIQRHPLNAGPGNRVGPSMAIQGHTLYFFGGLDESTFTSFNDMWSYNLITNRWTRLSPNGAPGNPTGRYLAKTELLKGKIYIFSGNLNPSQLGVQLNDFWVYEISSNTFTQIPTPPSVISRVHGASAHTSKSVLMSLGDTNNDTQECKVDEISGGQFPQNSTDVYRVKGDNLGWNPQVHIAHQPKLKRVAYAQDGDTLYVWGGYDFNCNKVPCPDGTHCYNPATSLPTWNDKLFSLNTKQLDRVVNHI